MVLKVTFAGPEPQHVFTPRGEFNPKMYTPRRHLEADFAQNLRLNSHLVLHGESGCGKSWLYKSFFQNNLVHYKIVNLADVSRNGKIATEILRVVEGKPTATLTGYDEKKAAEVGVPAIAKGTLDHTNKYTLSSEDPLRKAIRDFRRQAGEGHAFLVFDNLERIFDKDNIMEELADIITLADDEEFIRHRVRFLLVGVPSGVKEYFSKTPSHRTIANRLVELEEVSRLSHEEASNLITNGFEKELKYSLGDRHEQVLDQEERAAKQEQSRKKIINHIEWVTDKIPQAIQEYCLQLAFLAEKSNKIVAEEMLETADKKWLKGALGSAYSVIEGQLNERDTTIQRRNQVLYVLGRIDAEEFKANQIEEKIRAIFQPNDPVASIGGVSNALSDLAGTNKSNSSNVVLRKTPKGDAYMFIDPIYRMCIRAMLRIGANNRVEKISTGKVS